MQMLVERPVGPDHGCFQSDRGPIIGSWCLCKWEFGKTIGEAGDQGRKVDGRVQAVACVFEAPRESAELRRVDMEARIVTRP
jgi:hypothetical protein